jgi:hypothetical protein
MPSNGDCTKGVRCSDDTIPTCSDGSNWVLVNGVPICSDGSNPCDSGTVNVNACTKCLHCLNLDIPIYINSEAWVATRPSSVDIKFGIQATYFPNLGNMQQRISILNDIIYLESYSYIDNGIACVDTQSSCQKMLSVRINKDSDLVYSDIFDTMCGSNGAVIFTIVMSVSSSTVTEVNRVVSLDIPTDKVGSTWVKTLDDNTNLMLGTQGIATLNVPLNTLKVSSEGNSDVNQCCTLHVTNPLTINIVESNCFKLSVLYKFAFISTSGYTASIGINWDITVDVYIGNELTVALSKTDNITLTSNKDIFSSTPLCTTQLYGCFVATNEQKAAMKSAGRIRVVITIKDKGTRHNKLSDLAIGYTANDRVSTKTIYSLSSDTHKTFIIEPINIDYSKIDFTGNKEAMVTNITALNYSSTEGMVNSTDGMKDFHVIGDTCAILPARQCIYVKLQTLTSHCKHTASSAFTDLNLIIKVYFLTTKPEVNDNLTITGDNLALLEEIRDVVPKDNQHSAIKYTIEWDMPYYDLNNDRLSIVQGAVNNFSCRTCDSKLREALSDSSINYVFFTISIYNPSMNWNFNTAFYNIGDANSESLRIQDFMNEDKVGLKGIGWHRIFTNESTTDMNSAYGKTFYTYFANRALRSNKLTYIVRDESNVSYSNSLDCDSESWYNYKDSTTLPYTTFTMGWTYYNFCAGDYRQFYSKKAVYLYGVSKDTFKEEINTKGEWVLPKLQVHFGRSCVAAGEYKCNGYYNCKDEKYFYILARGITSDYDETCIDAK